MNTKNNQVFLDLQGNPDRPDAICMSHGHGHYAYVSTNDTFISEFFRNICIWGGATDTHETIGGIFYSQFELDCRDKSFFKSDSFKKICQKHDIELIIFDDHDDNKIIIDFWNQMRRR